MSHLIIISHKHRFIFIKTRKTAGTSIEIFLSRFCGDNDIVTPISPPVAGHRPRNYGTLVNHMDAATLRSALPEDLWSNYFVFCVERNPWDKTLSHFHSRSARFHDGRLHFDTYLRDGRFALNAPLYTDQGTIVVDRVVRYERLEAELSEVFSCLGIPFNGSLGIRAKSEYRQDRRDYQDVYTPAQRNFIEQVFAEEIALHGYAFESRAQSASFSSTNAVVREFHLLVP